MIATVPPITNLRPSVPAAVVDALQRALSKEPADRFNPVAQFGAAIAPSAIAASVASAANATAPQERSAVRTGRTRRNVFVAAAVAAIAMLAVFAWRQRAGVLTGTRDTVAASIAVLPFADLSADHANAYLGDGIAETLTNALVHVPGLTVVARNSAFAFRGREADVLEIGRQLRVGVVLSGSVQRVGDQLRISAQLVNAATGVNLWSEKFDRLAGDIFAVQDEVAQSAVLALKLTLAPDATGTAAPVGTRNAEAYNAYLLGRFHWNLRTSEGMVQSIAAMQRALALDSTYALAWAGLGDAYLLSTSTEYPSTPKVSDTPSVPRLYVT